MNGSEGFVRMRTLQAVVLLVFALILGRLAYIQLVDSRYDELARGNVLRPEVQYPPRGEVYDRNGEYLVQSRECYDLMVIYHDLDRGGFDTARLCDVAGISRQKLDRELANARAYPRAPRLVANYLSKEEKLRFDECNFRGFYTVYRTVRHYPRQIGGNLLGYVGEVTQEMLKRYTSYKAGDYVGISGVESAYESELKGRKGVKVLERDTHGAIKGSYMNGLYDSLPEPGRYLVSTIDARLQLLGEELMRGKVGAAVAIEPATGEILMMVSSPSYDPDELVGRERGNHYMEMLRNKRQPLYNRAVKSRYPPGSTFKLVQGLIGLQEGVLRPSDRHVCRGGYQAGRLKMKCHEHASPLDLRYAVSTSCNAYFCYVFRDILENPEYGGVKEGYEVWERYVESFGFGRKLGSDFLDEGNGYVPDRAYYDKRYRKSWNALTVLSLSIGQDALGCTPLQLANLAAIIANRGLLLYSAYRQADRGARFARRALLRTALHDGRAQALRTDRRGHVAERERGRNLPHGAARRLGRLRQDGHGAESARPRPFDLPLVRPEGQPEDRDLGLCRERRIRRFGRAADRQPARGVLPDGYHPPSGTARTGPEHANPLSRL